MIPGKTNFVSPELKASTKETKNPGKYRVHYITNPTQSTENPSKVPTFVLFVWPPTWVPLNDPC